MAKLKIASLHCFGSNPHKHAAQQYHFVHCAQATEHLVEWIYPEAPNQIEPDVVRNLLEVDMGCTADEVDAFGFENPRCWFRFTNNRYEGLEASMAHLADFCRRERPDGIAGYSNGAAAAMLLAAACDAGNPDFQSIRFLMTFAGPTSMTMQRHILEYLGSAQKRITVPTLVFGSRHDPMLTSIDQMARDLFEHCEFAMTVETRPYANHALPAQACSYEPVVEFLERMSA